jgi:hypothetical protein
MPPINISQDFMDWLVDDGFFTAPASTRYHGAYEGGLFDHSFAVAEMLVKMTEQIRLEWLKPRSPWVVGLFHDLCKIDHYIQTAGRFKSNKDTHLSGHGDKSVILLSQWIKLTEEESLCIRYHMGAYMVKEWNQYDRAIRKYPNVLWTHTADMYASKVLGL